MSGSTFPEYWAFNYTAPATLPVVDKKGDPAFITISLGIKSTQNSYQINPATGDQFSDFLFNYGAGPEVLKYCTLNNLCKVFALNNYDGYGTTKDILLQTDNSATWRDLQRGTSDQSGFPSKWDLPDASKIKPHWP